MKLSLVSLCLLIGTISSTSSEYQQAPNELTKTKADDQFEIIHNGSMNDTMIDVVKTSIINSEDLDTDANGRARYISFEMQEAFPNRYWNAIEGAKGSQIYAYYYLHINRIHADGYTKYIVYV